MDVCFSDRRDNLFIIVPDFSSMTPGRAGFQPPTGRQDGGARRLREQASDQSADAFAIRSPRSFGLDRFDYRAHFFLTLCP